MQDRRKSVRQRSLLGGRIEFNRTQTHDCIVRNVSAEGARLDCSASVMVPHIFDLLVVAHGERRSAKLMWRSETAIGISFHQKPALVPRQVNSGQPFLTLVSSH